MIQLDDNFLKELGLDALPSNEKQDLAAKLQKMVEVRVGERLTANMTDTQLEEFETITKKQGDDISAQWVKQTFPHYEKIVSEELEKLKGEIAAKAANGARAVSQPNQDLFEKLGMTNLSHEEKAKMSEDLGEVIMGRVATRMEAILTPEQAEEFEVLLQKDEATAFERLKQFVPNYDEIVQEEVDYMRIDMLETQAEVVERLSQRSNDQGAQF